MIVTARAPTAIAKIRRNARREEAQRAYAAVLRGKDTEAFEAVVTAWVARIKQLLQEMN